tara:strand:- start:64 stop:453 length:390 start_codon:yes stop_codon:yes gene_type:complete
MKKIYAVTSGEYSDYSVDCLFDSEQLAQDYIAAFSPDKYYPMIIEEFELNPFTKQLKKGYLPYLVRMTKEGKCTEVKISSRHFELDGKPHFDFDKNIYHRVFAKNEKHAIKILNEIRVQYIAMNKWSNY